MSGPVGLLDGDIIAYQASLKVEKEIDWGDGDGAYRTADDGEAARVAVSIAHKWLDLSKLDEAVVCFSPRKTGWGTTFRYHVYPQYKDKRTGEKPLAYWAAVSALEAEFPFQRFTGLEADDVMGILQTSDRFDRSVILSMDKDMQTIPGMLFNPDKDRKPRRVTKAAADRFWMYQSLTGDVVDCYPGCTGVGDIRANSIVGEAPPNVKAMWRAVHEAFLNRGHSTSHAITQARLARILRSEDYTEERETIALWHPTTPQTFSLTAMKFVEG